MSKVLPKELISLVSHVELNKEGWWGKAVQQLVLAGLWISGGILSLEGVKDCVTGEFHASLSTQDVSQHMGQLLRRGDVVQLVDGRFKISEQAKRILEAELKTAEDITNATRDQFISLLNWSNEEALDAWNRLEQELLLPWIKDLGANTYNLISGDRVRIHQPRLDHFLGAFEAQRRGVLQNAIDELLNPQNEVVRSYVLRLLNAHFFLEASRLDRGTLDLVGSFSGQPMFHIFFDTNFLFSLLQLHSNPSNESAKSLMVLLKQLSSRFRVKLYVLPITVDEAKRTLAAAEESITTTITPRLAAAALQLPQSGLMEKYLAEAANSPKALSPAEYFAPYITDLSTILKQRGIEVHKGDSEQYRVRIAVTDDINDQIEHEAEIKKRDPRFRVRDYRQWEHDLVLWHFVHNHRPAVLESPLSASHWLVTVDYRLLRFSSYRQRQSNESVPVGVHPATFLQMLQFFIPRSPEFEEAMLGSVRLPFLMREFDGDAERVTLRILRALSRFENVDDLQEGEIVSVLTNDALRGKLSTSESISGDEELQLVRDALIDEHKADRERFEAEAAAAKRASEIDAATVRALTQDLLAKGDEVVGAHRELEEQREALTELETQVSQLMGEVERNRRLRETAEHVKNYVLRQMAVPLLVTMAVIVGLRYILSMYNTGRVKLLPLDVMLLVIGISVFLGRAYSVGSKDELLQPTPIFQFVKRALGWRNLFVLPLVGTLVASALWEYVRSFFQAMFATPGLRK